MHLLIPLLLFELHAVISVPLSLGESDEDDGLAIPQDALNRPYSPFKLLKESPFDKTTGDNDCFCSYGTEEGICQEEGKCLKQEKAACFHAIKEAYNEETYQMEVLHLYGCATLEKGSDASHLTCHSGLSIHREPFSIACCYEGNLCNLNMTPPPYSGIREHEYDPDGPMRNSLAVPVIITSSILLLSIVLSAVFIYKFVQRRGASSDEKKLATDCEEFDPMLETSGSGSGSGRATLNQRTVAQDLKILKIIGQGRYGQVRKALYRGSFVAVKTFSTTDEESWKNERDIYYTEMFNHENILQFVAADICSEDSTTQMLLVTDYHELGSLSDYLRRVEALSLEEALQLLYSTACGLEHLHTSVDGTGGRRKPRIAHRDIKTKNVIVKRRGVCCIADFGLAVRFHRAIIPPQPKIQVGTKRYMAPEVLKGDLNPSNFSHFLMADMYAFALVLWEIARSIGSEADSVGQTEGRLAESSDSSGLGQSLSSQKPNYPPHTYPSESSGRATNYTPPFEGLVTNDPSFEEMRSIVCDNNLRPPITWKHSKNTAILQVTELMEDCWHQQPECRHSALKVKLQLKKVMDDFQGNRVPKVSNASTNQLRCTTDSGISRDMNSQLSFHP